MKILREYVWDTLWQNKRSGMIIMTALFLMTSLMSCFSGFVCTMWTDAVVLEKWHNGDWHGELFDNTPGSALEQIENYASVSAVLIKGDWQTARLPAKSGSSADIAGEPQKKNRRQYLIFRGANQEYWDSMPEKDTITQGRIPASETEIALPKQYFEDHPETRIGDTLTLPVGQRIYNGQACTDTDLFHEGETFLESETKTYTIVGSMDVTTSSSVPAYTGMTWLDESSIRPDDQITVYLRFDPMRNTYRELPALAGAIGYETNEYGDYVLRYNTGLLSVYGIFAPTEKIFPVHMSYLAVPLMFLLFTAFLVAVFVLVIHNAFVMSVNEKLIQLGTLAGVGATPKQIRKTVRTEALILTAVPLPLGILTGWFLVTRLFELINASNDLGREAPDIAVTYGLPAILPAILLSLLTAWLSAQIPARKAARRLPVEILKQEETLEKTKRIHFPGITGELAANAVAARSRSYRMATVSLCMSFLLLAIFQYIISVQDANDNIFRTDPSEGGHIFLSVSDGRPPDMEAIKELKSTRGVTKAFIHNSLSCAVWIDPSGVSEDIDTHLGGMDQIIAKKKYSPIKRDGKYRIASVIYGLEEDSFREYCEKLGISAQPYLDDPTKALVYNYTKDPENSTRRNVLYRELLDIQEGEKLTFTEKNTDEIEGNYEFTLTVGALIDEQDFPAALSGLSNFTLAAIMPMEHVLKLGESCCEGKQASSCNISAIFWTGNENSEDTSGTVKRNSGADGPESSTETLPGGSTIKNTTARLEKSISGYYGSGDYFLSNLAEREEMAQSSGHVMNLVVTFLTAFLAIIGLSNVWVSISGNLRHRRQEFAMLKSVGLSPRQLWKMLFLEGVTLGLRPLIYSLPFQTAVLAALLTVTEISLPEYLPYAPVWILSGYTFLILLAIVGAYAVGGRKLQRENIITAIRDDTL